MTTRTESKRNCEVGEAGGDAGRRTGSMLHWVLFLSRPFGISLGLFIALNLFLALKEPILSATNVWLGVPLSEPWRSLFASILGVALLAPHKLGERRWLRLLAAGIILGFLLLVLSNAFAYYHKLFSGDISTHAKFPFSLVVALILAMELARVLAWRPARLPLPAPAKRFFGTALVGLACFVLILAHIYTFGMTDYSQNARGVQAAVILGARVYRDGTLSTALRDRVDRGVELFKDGVVRFLILSGGTDASGTSEPMAMATHAMRRSVPPGALIFDLGGNTTYDSARNCASIARDEGFDALIVVSQYFHNARVKLIFERSGVRCYTVPARPSRPFRREVYFLCREAVA